MMRPVGSVVALHHQPEDVENVFAVFFTFVKMIRMLIVAMHPYCPDLLSGSSGNRFFRRRFLTENLMSSKVLLSDMLQHVI